MRCPRCAAENGSGRRFCGQCGTPLGRPCPACGFANDGGVLFCGGCGDKLDAGGPDLALSEALAPDRRPVTVLFADLVGFMPLVHEVGAEVARGLLDAFFATADRIVAAHGGTVDKHIGDCVMALFGAPVARGNDAERAVRAALAIRAALAQDRDRIGRELQVHTGIASGTVVAGGFGEASSAAHRAYTVTGDAVNLAERLARLAGPGEIFVSESVFSALADRLEVEPLGRVAIKGLPEAVPAYRLLGAAPRRVEPDGMLVGREAELERLTALLEQARADGTCRVALIRGDPGIGKTRLVAELRRRAPGLGFACHTALVLDFGAGEGHDAVEALARELALAGEAEAPVSLPAELHPFLLQLLGQALPPAARSLVDALNVGERRAARRRAVAAILAARAAESPRLLIVEDLHWAEPGMLDELTALVDAAATLPVAIVLTTRRDGDPLDEQWCHRAGASACTLVDLAPLRRTEARVLARRILSDVDGVLERCVERAQGNPLFLEQLLRHARELSSENVPGTVHSLVQARLDSLEGPDRAALRAASVLGQRFGLPELRALLERPDYAPANLVRRHLLHPLGDGYLFAHALIRDAVYDSLLRSRRRDLHRAAASWFAGRDPTLEAQHLERAEDPGAAAAYATAAEGQAALYRSEAALELAGRGLDLARDPRDRFRLLGILGGIRLDLGQSAPAFTAFEEAAALAGNARERCRSRLGLAGAMRLADRIEEALAVLDQAEAAAREAEALDELVRVHHLRGNLLFPTGRIDACAAAHEAALQAAERTGSIELLAQALGGVGDAAYAQGRYLTARASLERCVRLAEEHGLGRIEVANRSMLSVCRALAGPLHGTEEEAIAAISAAVRMGRHRRAEIIARHGAILGCMWSLRLEEAERHVARAEELTAEIGALRFRPENTAFRAEILRLGGHRAEAARLAAEALDDAEATAPRFFGPWTAGVLAAAALDDATREHALAAGERLLADTALRHNHLFFCLGAIEGCLEAGANACAAAYADRLERELAAEPMPHIRLLVARARALAGVGQGTAQLVELVREAEALGYLWLVPRLRAAMG